MERYPTVKFKGGEYRENAEKLMSLEYHENNMPWERIFEKALAMDYRSHQTSTCGLHIHIDRMALGSEHIAQEEVVARIVYFVEAHWDELLISV